MALILSLETSTTVCSVALQRDSTLLTSMEVHIQKSHSQILTLLCEQAITNCNLKFSDIDAFAVSAGPGSYTGLRIGTSTIKGFCYALEKPMIAVNTLEAMARVFNRYNKEEYLVCPMIDARRMEVYNLLTDANNTIIEPTAPRIIDETFLSSYLEQQKVAFIGNGAEKTKSVLGHYSNARFFNSIHPSAVGIAEIAAQKFEDGRFEDLAYFEPDYLKEFVSTAKN